MQDQELLQDCLSCEKSLASSYLQAVGVANSPLLQDTLSQMLSNVLQNAQMIAQEMQSYNWIQPSFASQTDLEQLQARYQLKGEELKTQLEQNIRPMSGFL